MAEVIHFILNIICIGLLINQVYLLKRIRKLEDALYQHINAV